MALFSDPSLVTRQMVDDVLKYKRLDGVNEALMALAEDFFTGGAHQQLPTKPFAPGVPTLIIWGEQDRVIPVAHAHMLPGARTEIVPGAGHMVQMEVASRVNELLLGFLNRTE